MRLSFPTVLCVAASLGSSASVFADDQPAVDYQRDVLPLLQNHCYKCHDAKKKESAYQIDARSTALRGGESGKPAIVPGNSSKSELIRRISLAEGVESMPAGKEKLTGEQIKLLRAWVDGGATWPDALANESNVKHWAFRAPTRPELPLVKNDKWVRNSIDRFILARLEKEGLAPSPEADRVTLIRRLSLDLIGLPPTVKEVDDFLADKSDKAYNKVVERLLASPHYGERWGRLWLDAARYADSDGFEKDKPRFVWAYRDWVINALNRDLPYDRFIIEQVAGDLLPAPVANAPGSPIVANAPGSPTVQDQITATGYLRNSMINEEGGIDPEQFRMEAMFDRMDAIGKGVLGLTIQCAQCHAHKFDPLTQTEYYRLFAFLNNCNEANVAVYTPEEQMKRADIFRQIREIETGLKHREPKWADLMKAWERQVKDDQPDWKIVRPELDASGDEKYTLQDDGSVVAAGYAPTKHSPEFVCKTDQKTITGVRFELLNDGNLPLGGPGRSIKGLFALTEFRVFATPADGARREVKIIRATADVNPPIKELDAIFDDRTKRRRVTGPIEYVIDGKDETAWTTEIGPGRNNVPRKAVFVFEEPISFPKGGTLTFRLTQNHGGWNSDDNQNNNVGRFRFSVTDEPNPVADPLPANVRALLSVPADKRTPAQTDTIFSYWRTTLPEWKEANAKIEALWKQHPEGASQLVLQAREMPRETHVLKRGDFLKPAAVVAPGVPAFLHPLPKDEPPTRLTLAKWLAARESPTTARVLVNRVWQAYFGAGLVTTPEDFGRQADKPSHPELLDWLAVEFMDPSQRTTGDTGDTGKRPGWSQKDLHRLIVTSATYRQSSKVTPELLERDPQNRLLARGPRFRADAEVVRDVALAASGLLNDKVGGPSVFPPLPAFMLLPPVSYGPKVWKESTGTDRYRRALYTFRFRSLPYPALQAFDAPNGDFACVRRSRSNTPLQALTALNEPVFVECAQALGLKAVTEGGDTDADRLTFAFRRCIARKPTAEETAELLALLKKEKERFGKPDAKPLEVAGVKEAPKGTTPADLAAWTIVSRVLLNLDETVTKD